MADKERIINDLKEMIYKLQIECVEKTDNILALGEQLKSAEKTIEILEAKIGGYEYAISDIVKEYQGKLDGKEQECEKAKQNAQDTYDLWQALIESFNILQGEKIKLEQKCEELKKQLESTKGLVTVGNKQLAEALLELQKYKDNEQREIELNKIRADGFKEMQKTLYEKFDGNSLIDYKNKRGVK